MQAPAPSGGEWRRTLRHQPFLKTGIGQGAHVAPPEKAIAVAGKALVKPVARRFGEDPQKRRQPRPSAKALACMQHGLKINMRHAIINKKPA